MNNISKKSFNIVLDTLIHLIISLEISIIVYIRFGNIFYVFLAILGGILIDIDHTVDYFVHYKKISLKSLIYFPYQKKKRVYLFFHSWELVILLSLIAFSLQSKPLQIFCFAWGLHLLVDNLDDFKEKGFFYYFLFYRLSKEFKVVG
ncbi:MAG: hypothetical protein K9L71_02065 [Candidatus Omnitrophica bacterium]|nr:hypothetical protein [Candidatus Omnitrophota bacterium]